MWWRRSEQTNRTSAWNAMNGITFVFGSLSTYGLGHIKTDKLHSYQVCFPPFVLQPHVSRTYTNLPIRSSSSTVDASLSFSPSSQSSSFQIRPWKQNSGVKTKETSLSKDSEPIRLVSYPENGDGNMSTRLFWIPRHGVGSFSLWPSRKYHFLNRT